MKQIKIIPLDPNAPRHKSVKLRRLAPLSDKNDKDIEDNADELNKDRDKEKNTNPAS